MVGCSGLVAAGAIAIAQTGAVIGRVWWSWLGKEGRRRLAMATLSLAAGTAACLTDGSTPAGHPDLAVVRPCVRLRRHSDRMERPVGGCRGRPGPAAPRGKRSRLGLTLVNLASAPGPWLLGAVYSLSGSFRIMWLLLGLLLACSLPAALLVLGPRAAARKDVKPKAYARQPGTGQAGSPVSGGPDDQ